MTSRGDEAEEGLHHPSHQFPFDLSANTKHTYGVVLPVGVGLRLLGEAAQRELPDENGVPVAGRHGDLRDKRPLVDLQ